MQLSKLQFIFESLNHINNSKNLTDHPGTGLRFLSLCADGNVLSMYPDQVWHMTDVLITSGKMVILEFVLVKQNWLILKINFKNQWKNLGLLVVQMYILLSMPCS